LSRLFGHHHPDVAGHHHRDLGRAIGQPEKKEKEANSIVLSAIL